MRFDDGSVFEWQINMAGDSHDTFNRSGSTHRTF